MGAETSDPGGQDTIDQAEEENMMAGMTDAQSQAQMSEAGLSMGFGDFAGSTALSNQESDSLTGSNLTDALVPGIGTLSLISSISAQQTQASLQQGASPVYGSSGNVSNTTARRITPSAAVRGASLAPKLYAMSSRGRGRGIKTSPQGILGSAPVQRKTLLGS
jgi:hypothetical protein